MVPPCREAQAGKPWLLAGTRSSVRGCDTARLRPQTMTVALLPLPDDPRFQRLIDEWPDFQTRAGGMWPRSAWLRTFEDLLRLFYPQASSDSLTLTARHYAPFPLAEGHNVP